MIHSSTASGKFTRRTFSAESFQNPLTHRYSFHSSASLMILISRLNRCPEPQLESLYRKFFLLQMFRTKSFDIRRNLSLCSRKDTEILHRNMSKADASCVEIEAFQFGLTTSTQPDFELVGERTWKLYPPQSQPDSNISTRRRLTQVIDRVFSSDVRSL